MLSLIGVILLLAVFGATGHNAYVLLASGCFCIAVERIAEALEKRA